MPRQPRLDAPGLLQHVIARGRRLMTGYVVNFNKRHKRSGHLFQNRYKSIVCEEYSYLLELVRYIHLNPLRAGLVKDLKELDKYPWSGHSVILGRRENPLIPGTHIKESVSAEGRFSFSLSAGKGKKHEKKPDHPACPAVAGRRWIDSVKTKSLAEKTIEDVLLHFGDTINVSRRIYRDFVKKGIDQGRRADLQGGGLVRSAGGDKRGLLGRNKEEREQGDARILGSGDFVGETLQKAEARFEKKYQPRRPIEELVSLSGMVETPRL